ncbi:MAG: lysophospholipid acyltransferase family protein [Phycisphaerales bacterium]|nr:lysophospholipid acyltransferase family protein [Phycisphaerales bacterium]
MARNTSALVNWSQYLPLRMVAGLIQCFSPEQNLRTAAGIGSMFWRWNSKRRERTLENIRLSFPDWDEDRIREVGRRSFEYMFQLAMVDSITMGRAITPDTWPDTLKVPNIAPVLEKLVSGRPMLMLTGHCGNWELLGYGMSVIGYPLTAIARPLDNPLINEWVLRIREAHGLRVLTKWGVTPELQRTIETGGNIGFIADQNAGDQGVFVPFFGRLASSYKSIALLAMRYELPIVCAQARRIGQQFKYELVHSDIIEPEEWRDADDPLFMISARYSHAIETLIRQAPEQYLWLHRRWKSRPRHERQGRPMPESLVEKIRNLPWMTDEELNRIVEHSNRSAKDAA